MAKESTGLFGITNSNRNFTEIDCWGKNQFNSSFPAALACYMGDRGIKPVYLSAGIDGIVRHGYISVEEVFGMKQLDPSLRFEFEVPFAPHSELVHGGLSGIDLVTKNSATKKYLRALEVKLTVLPDNQTFGCAEDQYGSELVIRPDTIEYIALSIATVYAGRLKTLGKLLADPCDLIKSWQNGKDVEKHLPALISALRKVLVQMNEQQVPFLMQPIWKTIGKAAVLAEQCFDLFVWSDVAMATLILDKASSRSLKTAAGKHSISRPQRCVVWIAKMLFDFAQNGKFNPKDTTRMLTSGESQTDKAFAVGGKSTHPYMTCKELTQPRVKRTALSEIVLGKGAEYLSPERRLDAVISITLGASKAAAAAKV
jgi:hypothetical protein